VRIQEIASVVRSKNAGPYIITFDVFFADRETYQEVRQGGLLEIASVARAYGVSPNEILDFAYYDFAAAVKFSLRRIVVSGGQGDGDVYGAQQHAPLLDLVVL